MELLSLEEEGVAVAPLPDRNKQVEFEDVVKKEQQSQPSPCVEETDDSAVVSDEDFFDAQEDIDEQSLDITEYENATIAAESSPQHTRSLNDIEKEENANNSDSSKEETVDMEVCPEQSKSEREHDDESSRSKEEKYVVKNKDTGETFDIRELNSTPIDSYTMFPNDFTALQNQVQPEKKIKKTGSGLSKLKIKFPKKSKTKETVKKTNIQVMCNKKERRDFEELILAQTLSRHNGTIWTMKFSHDGARLVTGGQDAILRVWKVAFIGDDSPAVDTTPNANTEKKILENEPEQSYQGHTMPIVDVSWSRSNFILSASMDKTVRLWHISREDCLHVFQHPDSVPAVDFHPKEDRYFLSGCFDNKARIWDIPDGCVVSYVQTPVMITAATFNPSGSRAIVGLLNGQCIFYQVNAHQQMNYYTQIECRNSRGPMKKGRKVTGIEFDPEGKYFMVSTNDSRMRLYSVDNYSRICKYKGLVNDHLQIKGRFSQDGEFVICGSENGHVYIWNKSSSYLPSMRVMKSGKHDRNASYEYFNASEVPNGIVTAALFAPASTYAMVKNKLQAAADIHSNACTGLIVTASYDGSIKFFEKTVKGC